MPQAEVAHGEMQMERPRHGERSCATAAPQTRGAGTAPCSASSRQHDLQSRCGMCRGEPRLHCLRALFRKGLELGLSPGRDKLPVIRGAGARHSCSQGVIPGEARPRFWTQAMGSRCQALMAQAATPACRLWCSLMPSGPLRHVPAVFQPWHLPHSPPLSQACSTTALPHGHPGHSWALPH